VIWDHLDPRVFTVSTGSQIWAYLFVSQIATGPGLQLLGCMQLPATHVPVVVANGAVTCRLKSGALDTIVLESHRAVQGPAVEGARGGAAGGVIGGPMGGGGGAGAAAAAKGNLTKRCDSACCGGWSVLVRAGCVLVVPR